MPISATFTADFTQFVGETKKADASLQGLMGRSVRLGDEFAKTQSNADRFRGSLSQFDGVLASLGVNIGSEVRALGELGAAAGKTASEMGLIGTAGLAAGAALAGWQIGRAVADFFDLDKAISETTAALLGWGDVSAEVAGAQADLHARIMATGTSMEFYHSQAQLSANATKVWSDELSHVTDLDQLTKDLDSQNFSLKELAVRYGVTVEALQFFQREQRNASEEAKKATAAEKEAADAIHTNNARKLRDLKEQVDAQKASSEALQRLGDLADVGKAALAELSDEVRKQIEHYLKLGGSVADVALKFDVQERSVLAVKRGLDAANVATQDAAREQDRLADAANAAADALEREREAAERLRREAEKAKLALEALKKANREMGGSTQFDVGTEAGRAAIPEGIKTWLHDGYSLAQAAQIDFLMRWGLPINANDPLFRTKGPRVPGFAGGVENFGGGLAMVGERGPELVHLPGGSDVIPFGGGGAGVVNNFYLIDNSENLARKTANLIMASVKRGQKLGFS